MKKGLFIISVILGALVIATIGTLKAEITEVGDSWVMLSPLSEYPEGNSSDKISLSGWIGEDDVEVGDIIGIYYGGEIMESYPAQLAGVYKIEIYDDNGDIRDTVTERSN